MTARRQRVLITGMGGELGTRVAALMDVDPAVEALVGIDVTPPRRRLERAVFHRLDPRNRARCVEVVADFCPTTVIHLGIYEPDARSTPTTAIERTAAGSISILGAAVEAGALNHIVMRSGIEVYGRRRGALTCPAEDAPLEPSTPYGRALRHAEQLAGEAARDGGVPLAVLRLASVMGPSYPSPLGRVLRLRAVPVSALSDLPFSLLHQEDAARVVAAAVERTYDGAVNIVADGAVTAFQAARLGGRIPIPVVGPAWRVARAVSELAGAPVPPHVVELLTRGRTADGSLLGPALGVGCRYSTPDIVKQMYEWASVSHLTLIDGEAAA